MNFVNMLRGYGPVGVVFSQLICGLIKTVPVVLLQYYMNGIFDKIIL